MAKQGNGDYRSHEHKAKPNSGASVTEAFGFASIPSQQTRESLESEAEKLRAVPGIVFADGAAGRRARIVGTGIEVFEIIKAYRQMDCDLAQLRIAYDWLTSEQLQAALTYAVTFPEEIEQRLKLEDTLEERHAFLPG